MARAIARVAVFASIGAAACFGSGDNARSTRGADGGSDANLPLLDAGPVGQDATASADTGPGAVDAPGEAPDAPSASDGGCPGTGAPRSFTCTGSLAAARIAPGGAPLDGGKALVAGGWNPTDLTLASAEVFDVKTGTFSATGPMSVGHLWAGWAAKWPVLDSGKVLVAGGLDKTGALSTSAELYDPVAGTFTATGSLGTGVIAFAPTMLKDGTVLFLGGYSQVTGAPPTPGWSYTAGSNGVQRYDPTAGTFVASGMLAEPRLFGCNVALPSGGALAIGGWVGVPATFEANIEQFDPTGGNWTTVGTLTGGATCSARAFLLPNGKVLLDSMVLFDPATYTTAPTMGGLPNWTPTWFVQLLGGDVLAYGGKLNGTITATAQIYGASANTWSAVGNLHQARDGARGFLLTTGEVLVVGGADPNGNILATAEIYHP